MYPWAKSYPLKHCRRTKPNTLANKTDSAIVKTLNVTHFGHYFHIKRKNTQINKQTKDLIVYIGPVTACVNEMRQLKLCHRAKPNTSLEMSRPREQYRSV